MKGAIQKPIGADFTVTRSDEVFLGSIKALMLAVLKDAMLCCQSCKHSRRRAEAQAWLFDREADGPFAFETICHALRIDPGYLRMGLRRWRMQQVNRAEQRRIVRRTPVMSQGEISAFPLRRRRRAVRSACDTGSARAIHGSPTRARATLPLPQER